MKRFDTISQEGRSGERRATKCSASSVAGVVAKLRCVLETEDTGSGLEEEPWPQLRNIIVFLAQIMTAESKVTRLVRIWIHFTPPLTHIGFAGFFRSVQSLSGKANSTAKSSKMFDQAAEKFAVPLNRAQWVVGVCWTRHFRLELA